MSHRLLCIAALVLLASVAWSDEVARKEPKVVTNSIGMKLALIPAGEFTMGSDARPEELRKFFPQYGKDRYGEDRLVLKDEAPAHKVRITRPFYMGQHEVTIANFRKFVETGYKPESIADGTGGYGYLPNKPESGEAFDGRDPKYSWLNPGFKQGEDHPVVNVTWNDAQAMCQWLSEKEGKKYRLPTEAEWEYCCRAGTKTQFHSGDDPQSLLKAANTFDQECAPAWKKWEEFALEGSDGFEFTSPVGKFAPNAFGLHDMHGNVWEWCSDYHADDYYSKSPTDDPQGPTDGSVRVRRGGSWHTWALYCRSAYRNVNSQRTRYVLQGIRLVREE
jgi:formylglycine-generating enzyme